MPNVIVELTREMHRVEQLLPSLRGAEFANARQTVGYARTSLMNNSLEAMREVLDELRAITGEPKKP